MKIQVNRNEKSILKRLSTGLSEQEIQRVLAEALDSLDQAGVVRLLQRVGPKTGAALRQVLDTHHPDRPPMPGTGKIKEEWERAWEDWDARIAEACDGEGDYVIQEHHWEEPYFDPLGLTHDLEPIAARMRKLIPRVIEENIDPKFSFIEAVQEAVKDIESSMPDWIDPFMNEGFGLGPEATACLIEWEWLRTVRQKTTPFRFIERLCQLDVSTNAVGLDEKAIARFIHAQNVQAKQEIFRGIQAKSDQFPWKQALDSAHSGWFQIYKELCRAQDRPAYLESCRARISQNWTLALPLLRDLERKKNYAEALDICTATLRSFLHLREGEKWDLPPPLIQVPLGDSPRLPSIT